MIMNRQNNISELKIIFEQIFRSNDPFGKTFVPSISNKIILYPTWGFYLSEEQFAALISSIKMYDETSFYLSEIEGPHPFIKTNTSSTYTKKHLELSIDTPYNEYTQIAIIFENAIYSSNKKWGVIISHEDHAVIGGPAGFIETFKKQYPDWQDDQKKFIEAIQYWAKLSTADLSWLPTFIDYINEKK